MGESYPGSVKAMVCNNATSVIARCVIALAEWWFLVKMCHSKLDFKLRNKIVKCYIWSTASHGAETWKYRKVDQKYLENFEMLFLEKDGEDQLDRSLRNEEVLLRVKEHRNIVHEVIKREVN